MNTASVEVGTLVGSQFDPVVHAVDVAPVHTFWLAGTAISENWPNADPVFADAKTQHDPAALLVNVKLFDVSPTSPSASLVKTIEPFGMVQALLVVENVTN